MAIIIKPQIRKTSELPFHSDEAPGKRYVFVDKSLFPESKIYVIGRMVEYVPENQPEYVKPHRHNCNSFYIFIGDNEDLSGLEANVKIENREFIVKAPSAVMIQKYCLHNYKLTKGKGWFFHINLREDYISSLLSKKDIDFFKIKIPGINFIYKKAEYQLNKPSASERPLISTINKILNPERWIFVNQKSFQNPGVYVAVHKIVSDKPYKYEMKLHYHNTDEVYLILGRNKKELEINISDGKNVINLKSPLAIYHLANSNHKYKYVGGEGLILIIFIEKIPGRGYEFTPVQNGKNP